MSTEAKLRAQLNRCEAARASAVIDRDRMKAERDAANANLRAFASSLRACRSFILAYDAWAVSEEHCGGPLFSAMLDVRDALEQHDRSSLVTVGKEGDDGAIP